LLTGLLQQTSLTGPYAATLMIGGSGLLLLVIMTLPRYKHWHQERSSYA